MCSHGGTERRAGRRLARQRADRRACAWGARPPTSLWVFGTARSCTFGSRTIRAFSHDRDTRFARPPSHVPPLGVLAEKTSCPPV